MDIHIQFLCGTYRALCVHDEDDGGWWLAAGGWQMVSGEWCVQDDCILCI